MNEFYGNSVSNIELCDSPQHYDNKYSIPSISENSIIKIINNFSINKSKGSDGIPMRFLKLFEFSLILNLITIINKSIETNVFPFSWEIAKTIPLFKSGDEGLANNYRPIALLPIFGKIFEKHIETTFREFLMISRYLSEY